MQTFLPFENFLKSAKTLDQKRLGKQRVEVLQILKALNGETKGWVNHPATKMWRGHEDWLIEYGLEICREWVSRGYKDTCAGKIAAYKQYFDYSPRPDWLGNEKLHISHQSNLVRKDKQHYKKLFPNAPDNLDYVWPV